MVDAFLQRSLEVGEALCAAPEPHALTEVVTASSADATLATWNADFESNTVTDGEARHMRADGHHLARRLVAEGQWLPAAQVSVGILLIVADVRATDAGRAYGDLELTRARIRDVSYLLRGSVRLASPFLTTRELGVTGRAVGMACVTMEVAELTNRRSLAPCKTHALIC